MASHGRRQGRKGRSCALLVLPTEVRDLCPMCRISHTCARTPSIVLAPLARWCPCSHPVSPAIPTQVVTIGWP